MSWLISNVSDWGLWTLCRCLSESLHTVPVLLQGCESSIPLDYLESLQTEYHSLLSIMEWVDHHSATCLVLGLMWECMCWECSAMWMWCALLNCSDLESNSSSVFFYLSLSLVCVCVCMCVPVFTASIGLKVAVSWDKTGLSLDHRPRSSIRWHRVIAQFLGTKQITRECTHMHINSSISYHVFLYCNTWQFGRMCTVFVASHAAVMLKNRLSQHWIKWCRTTALQVKTDTVTTSVYCGFETCCGVYVQLSTGNHILILMYVVH